MCSSVTAAWANVRLVCATSSASHACILALAATSRVAHPSGTLPMFTSRTKLCMRQPPGSQEGPLGSMLRALYVSKQASCARYNKLDATLMSLGFVRTSTAKHVRAGPCPYVNHKLGVWVLVCVNDPFTAARLQGAADEVLQQLGELLDLRGLGDMSQHLGLSIMRDRVRRRLWLGQPVHATLRALTCPQNCHLSAEDSSGVLRMPRPHSVDMAGGTWGKPDKESQS
jgi:hypothetical protein